MTPIIGLEIHCELKTQSKMFCGCSAAHFGVEPNTHTCPVCLGLPGALPVPNQKAIEWTIMIGHALGSTIKNHSKFDRKHYFYPDLPKGYQISQYDEPLCEGGEVETKNGVVHLTRVHLEEDTGKLQHTTLPGVGVNHDSPNRVSLVDFNRGGVPLVEIVSEPEIHSAAQAKEYAQTVRNVVQFLKVSNGDLEKGSMRLEANISWGLDLGYKVEVKNINSFRFLEAAIDYELKRQKELLDQGVTPAQETRGWNETKNQTFPQRSKEEAQDYRYFPEPDIPPLEFSDAIIAAIKNTMPKLPAVYRNEFETKYGIRPDFATTLTEHRKLAEKASAAFSLAKDHNIDPQDIANWLINKKAATEKLEPEAIVKLIQSSSVKPTASTSDLETWVAATITNNPDVVAKYKSGKTAVIGVLIGEVMKKSTGSAHPGDIKNLLEKSLQ